MALVCKWDGIGVSDGTLGSKAGSGDTAFDMTNLSPSVNGEVISKTGNTQHRWGWDLSSMGAFAVRFHLTQRAAPGGTSTLAQAWNTNTPSGRIFALQINTSNQITLRNSSNTTVWTSPAIELGRDYCIDVHKAAGNSTVSIYIYDLSTQAEHSSGSGSPGTSSTIGYIVFGQESGTNSGGYRYSHMRIDDTNARIGPFVGGASDFDTQYTRYGSTTSASSHTVPLPGTQWGDLLIANLRSSSGATPAIPGGWSGVGGDGDIGAGSRVVYRLATGSEGSSMSVTTSASTHLAAVVVRVRSSGTLSAALASSDTTAAPEATASRSGERNLWLALNSWWNSDAGIVTAASSINSLVQQTSGSASGRPGAAVGERRWTGDALTPGSPSSVTGTLASPRAGTIVVQFDVPSEPPSGDNLEWFIWDGVALEAVDILGAWEGA